MEPESYLDVALTKWLPRRWESGSYERALDALAVLFEERHGDRWLLDVLAAKRSDGMAAGLAALAEAVRANLSDESDRALEKAGEAVRSLRAAGDDAGALRAELEEVYALERALRPAECLERTAALVRKAEAKDYSWILGQTFLESGTCRGQDGDWGAAHHDRELALGEIRRAGYQDLELRAAGILSGAQTVAGNLLVAWNIGRKGLATYWSGPYRGVRAHQIYFNLYRSAENLGQRQAAYVFAKAAALAIVDTPRRRTEASTRARVARLAVEAGWFGEANAEFERAGKLFAQLDQTKADREYRARAELDRAEGEVAAGSSQAALYRLEAIRSQAENIGSAVIRIRFQQVLGDALWRSDRRQLADAAYRAAVELTEQRLATLPGSQERAGLMLAAAKAYRGLAELLCERGDFAGALRLWEWFRAGEAAGQRTEPDLDRRLPKLARESFLSYSVLPGGIVAWVYDDRGIQGRRLTVKSDTLEAVAFRFLRECADAGSSRQAIHRDARQLYDWLIAPLSDRLDPKRTLVVEPDGAVGAIPMQALMDANSLYLGERFAITVANGLVDYQRRMAAGPVTAGSKALVVANPALGKETTGAFPPLVQTKREGQRIAARFGNSVLLTGEQATVTALEQHRPETELFHFAGHGFSNAGNGGILLAPERNDATGAGVLEGKRMAQQDWSRCRLAVLSACSTGTGEARGPVNPESLVRGLLWAGVARVVGTRWNVDAETGVLLMDRFYEALLSGSDAAAALQRAAQRIRDNTATSHPYYWAGFQNFGSR